MPNPRKTITVLSTLATLGAFLVVSAPVGAKSLPTCTKAGSLKTVGVNQFRCVKSKGRLTVFGAASLTTVLPKLANAFRASNPGVRFTFSFAGSSTLAQQIIAGAPADLFFSAGPAPMGTVGNSGGIDGRASNFASNSLVIAVPRGNPTKITGLADLAKTGVTFLICAPQVPCGSAAAKVLTLAKIVAKPVSLENDVKSVLTKVAMGEVDAGLVYRTDITSDVTPIKFPEAAGAINEYPAAVIRGSKSSTAAHAFMNFVLSHAGQTILQKAGFRKP
jgi:molybdate transport system substrate-binding protein